MRTPEEVFNKIMQLADEKGINLSELSRRVGVDKSTLSRYRSKTRPFNMTDVNKYADALNIDVMMILFDSSKERSRVDITEAINGNSELIYKNKKVDNTTVSFIKKLLS